MEKQNWKNGLPRIGAVLYIETELYIGHGEDDVRGGKAVVESVQNKWGSVWITFKGFSRHKYYSWQHLLNNQEKLRGEYGDLWAYPDPDYNIYE